eukprot:179141-Alexandrium_andersonii.AAC.1
MSGLPVMTPRPVRPGLVRRPNRGSQGPVRINSLEGDRSGIQVRCNRGAECPSRRGCNGKHAH